MNIIELTMLIIDMNSIEYPFLVWAALIIPLMIVAYMYINCDCCDYWGKYAEILSVWWKGDDLNRIMTQEIKNAKKRVTISNCIGGIIFYIATYEYIKYVYEHGTVIHTLSEAINFSLPYLAIAAFLIEIKAIYFLIYYLNMIICIEWYKGKAKCIKTVLSDNKSIKYEWIKPPGLEDSQDKTIKVVICKGKRFPRLFYKGE